MPHASELGDLLERIGPLDSGAMDRARARQEQLTKPRGALGRLEELAVLIAGITGSERPKWQRPLVVVFAGDHGVAREGVSAYPSAVTAQMVRGFVRGTAAVSVLARQVGARLVVVDVGVAADLGTDLAIIRRKVRAGTRSMVEGPALTRAEALTALRAGAEVVAAEVERGADLIALGEMGIGNSTAAAAVTAALLGCAPRDVVGRGTGIDDATLARKIAVVERALAVNRPDPADPVGVLAAVGGLEIAALSGAILEAAARRRPVVLDGFICGAAALAAARLSPAVRSYLIAGHRSAEAGHPRVLAALGLEPLLDLGMRLGEGSGAVVALGVVAAALASHDGMATFSEAGVSERITGR
jgi:nicotinate-nucleotide--dimethylbenzimidazole phosphoribosyltransferase